MPAQTLFDISAIDLTQVAVTSDDVAGMNPQTGHMRHLDYVIWKSEDSTSGLGVKSVHDDEFWVDGRHESTDRPYAPPGLRDLEERGLHERAGCQVGARR